MLPDQEEVLRKANGLDLALVKIEILASVTIPEDFKNKSEILLQEYRRFLALKVIFGDTNLPLSLSPSAIIDQVWHIHMLMPGNYLKCCKELGVEIIEHDPSAARDALEVGRKRVEMTKKSYQVAFQKIPPEVFWAVAYNTVAYHRPSTSSSDSAEDEKLPAPAHKKVKMQNESDQKSSSSESEEDSVTHPKVKARNDEDKITFKVNIEPLDRVYPFKIKRSTKFTKVYQLLRQLTGVGKFYLINDTDIINPEDTASSLQLENDNYIEMRIQQSGC